MLPKCTFDELGRQATRDIDVWMSLEPTWPIKKDACTDDFENNNKSGVIHTCWSAQYFWSSFYGSGRLGASSGLWLAPVQLLTLIRGQLQLPV